MNLGRGEAFPVLSCRAAGAGEGLEQASAAPWRCGLLHIQRVPTACQKSIVGRATEGNIGLIRILPKGVNELLCPNCTKTVEMLSRVGSSP
jgi:hypothetical protein